MTFQSSPESNQNFSSVSGCPTHPGVLALSPEEVMPFVVLGPSRVGLSCHSAPHSFPAPRTLESPLTSPMSSVVHAGQDSPLSVAPSCPSCCLSPTHGVTSGAALGGVKEPQIPQGSRTPLPPRRWSPLTVLSSKGQTGPETLSKYTPTQSSLSLWFFTYRLC